jgi:hypothetical protein
MKTFNELSAGVVHWIFAGVISAIIASAIAWGLVQFFLENHDSGKARCHEKPCYNDLNKRLISVESSLKAEIAAKTDKRYRADDAERDQRILRKEIADVRTEVNMRIDKLHEEVHK